MKKTILMSGIILVGILLFACAPAVVPAEKAAAPDTASRQSLPTGKESWETQWEKTLQEARKEGVVAVFGGTTVAGLKESARLFKDKFGIELHITTGPGAQMVPKVLEERRVGLFLQDVHISGHTTMFDPLKVAGAVDPFASMLVIPEVVDQKLWWEGKFDWADIEGRYVFNFALYPSHNILVNTELVQPGEIRSYYDLLNPKWRGKIVINDPTIPGMGSSGFNAMVYNKLVDIDFFRQLAAGENAITRDQELQITWVARGKYSIALFPSLGRVARFTEAGAPVKPLEDIKEGVSAGSTGSALSLFNKAPHPNAARVFVNWFLSKEGQAISQKVVGKQTRRVDVPAEGLNPFETRVPGIKYFPKPDEREDFVLNEAKKYRELAEQVFAPLLK